MACTGCERRRVEMALMLEASRLWTLNPRGDNVQVIYLRLREEAIKRGEFE